MNNRFPVLNPQRINDCPKYVRMDKLSESMAVNNHCNQSLATLKSRGGLDPMEIYCNINKIEWRDISKEVTQDEIMECIKLIELKDSEL